MVDIQSEFGRPLLFALRRLYKVSEFRGMGTFSQIGERMDAGRDALYARGDDEVGPYQTPMEDGMPHFHNWYRRQLGDVCA